jgi:hypothetical protein
MFENRVLRRIFGPKKDELIGEYRKLHREELHNLYSFPNTIKQIKSGRMRWVGHVARMGGVPRWGVGIKINLRETGGGWSGFSRLGIGTVEGVI